MRGVLERDAKISKLMLDMEYTYSTANGVRGFQNEPDGEDLMKGLMKQTVECVALIREHSGRGFSGMVFHIYDMVLLPEIESGQTHAYTPSQEKIIDDFSQKFREFEHAFKSNNGLPVTFMSFRVPGRGDTSSATSQVHL